MSDTVAAPAAAPVAPTPAAPAEAPVAPKAAALTKEQRAAKREAQRQNPNHFNEAIARADARVKAREASANKSTPEAGASTEAVVHNDAGSVADTSDNAASSPSTPTEPAPTPAAEDRASRLAKIKAEAEALGLRFDGREVTVADRFKVREEQRTRLAKLQAKEAELAQTFQAKEKELESKGGKYLAFEKAYNDGDPDAMARALGVDGDTPWNTLQEKLLERIADPHYRKIQELETQLKSREEAENKAREEAQARAEQQRRHEQTMNVKRGIVAEAKAVAGDNEDARLLRALADDAQAVDTLYYLQASNYDPVTETTVSIAEALDERLPNGQTLRQIMKTQYERLSKVFAAAPPPAPAPKPAAKAPAEAAAKKAPAPSRTEPKLYDGAKSKTADRRAETDDRIRKYTQGLVG